MDNLKWFRIFLISIDGIDSIDYETSELEKNKTGILSISDDFIKRISPAILEYYKVFNHYRLEWVYPEKDGIKGSMRIEDLPGLLAEDWSAEGEQEEWQSFKAIDFFYR